MAQDIIAYFNYCENPFRKSFTHIEGCNELNYKWFNFIVENGIWNPATVSHQDEIQL